MNSAKFEIETVPANAAERVRAIRFRLPGQAVTERIELARVSSRVSYGPLYTIGLVRERDHHGLMDEDFAFGLAPFVYPDFTQELVRRRSAAM